MFFLPFDPEAFKLFKSTKRFLRILHIGFFKETLRTNTHSCGIIGKNLELINYLSISWDSKQKKMPNKKW